MSFSGTGLINVDQRTPELQVCHWDSDLFTDESTCDRHESGDPLSLHANIVDGRMSI